MFVVELVCSSQREEELAAVVVGSSVRHGDQTSAVEAQPGVKLILKRGWTAQLSLDAWKLSHSDHSERQSDLEGSAVDGLSAGSCPGGISTLDDEVTHHPVKDGAVIVS